MKISKFISLTLSTLLLSSQTLSFEASAQHVGNFSHTFVPPVQTTIVQTTIVHTPTLHTHSFNAQNTSAGQIGNSAGGASSHHSFFHHHQLDNSSQFSHQSASIQNSTSQQLSSNSPHTSQQTYGEFINALNSGTLSKALNPTPQFVVLGQHNSIGNSSNQLFHHHGDNNQFANSSNQSLHHHVVNNGSQLSNNYTRHSDSITTSTQKSLTTISSAATNVSNAFGLDLNSTVREIPADISHSVTILIGGTLNASGAVIGARHEMVIKPGELLTPAQYAAMQQVISSGGQQTLVVNNAGAAIKGTITLTASQNSETFSGAFIPKGVVLDTVGFSSKDPLNITGSATVLGSIVALQTTSNTSSTLDLGSLIVGTHGIITDIASNQNLLNNLMSSSGLSLNVINAVLNAGSIASGGVLAIQSGGAISNSSSASHVATMTGTSVNLSSGNGTFTNSGNIIATTGNVTLTAPNTQDIIVNNTSGNIESAQNINVRDPAYAGSANVTLSGGNWQSQALNLNDGNGSVTVNIGNVTGAVSTTASEEHFSANTNNLVLSNINVSGDPSYFNTGGQVTIASNLVFKGQDLAIIAKTNIVTAAGAGIISTASNTGNGGNITMVAGANFTSSGAAKGNDNKAATLTINGGTSAGGYIDLNGNISGSGVAISSLNSASTAGSGSGGNISLVAYGGTGASAGQISLPSSVAVTTGGHNSGTNGNVSVISGADSGNGISMGNINATGGTGGGGNISLYTATPFIVSGSGTMTIKDGSITNGASYGAIFGGTNNNAAITTGNLTSAGGSINVIAGTGLTTGSVISNGVSTNSNGGNITLVAARSSAANLEVNGDISANGNGSGAGGSIGISYSGSNNSPFLVGTSNTSNSYVSGNISANSGNSGTVGGNISISSFAPNPNNTIPAIRTPLNIALTGTISASAKGNNLGNITFNGQTINVIGSGTLNAVINNNSDAGPVTYAVGGGNLTLGQINNASGDINVTNNSVNGSILTTQSIASAGQLNISSASAGSIVASSGNILSGTGVSLDSGTGGITLQGTAGVSTNSAAGSAGNISIIANGGSVSFGTGSITAQATGATGNGGNITIQGTSFSANNQINASALNIGNGGNVSVQVVGAAGNLIADSAFYAQGGAISGNGGSVSLTAGQNLLVKANALINVGATSGNGGTINLTNGVSTPGTLFVNQSLSANGGGNGSGGAINIVNNSSSVFLISGASNNGIKGTLTANGGSGVGGSGGAISVTNVGSGGITLLKYSNVSVASSAGGGSGGTLYFNANNGSLTLPAGTINVNATGPGSYNGGSITLIGSSIVLSGGSGTTLSLLANASGSGNGGSIGVYATGASSDIVLGNAPGNIALISATGGSAGSNDGNGGSITLYAGRNLFIPNTPNIISVATLGNNGNGGSINLTNGAVTTGTLEIDQNLSANGSGNGSGGQIYINNNSNSVFLISGVSSNGINGILSANGGNGVGGSGGTVSVTNRGSGGITLVSYSDISVNPSLGGGAGGNITLNANYGLLTLPAGTMNTSAAGPGSYNGGSISLTGSSIVLNGGTGQTISLLANGFGSGNGGSVYVRTTSAVGDIILGNAPGNIASISATGGSAGSNAGNGGSITLDAGRNIFIPNIPNIITVAASGNNGNGGNINLTAGSALASNTNASLQVDQSLNANGVGTGNGGSIYVSYHDANNPLIVGGTGTNSYINGQILANAGNAGANGGNITIANTASGPLNVALLSNGTISANGGNLGNINFIPSSGQSINVAGTILGYGNLVGVVNATGTSVYINPQAANTTLTSGTIGSTSSSGFVMLAANNGNSTINLDGALTTNGGSLSVVSSGNIGSGGSARTSTAGGAITMLAGAAFITIPTSTTFTITGSSQYGGSLNLSSLTNFTTAASFGNTNGGDITLVALYGTNPNAGMITGPITTIYSGGSGTGVNGNVTIISGAQSPSAGIAMANTSINTVGGNGGGGNVTVSVTVPILNVPITIQNGAITTGSFATGALQTASLSIGNILTSTGNATVTSGGIVNTGSISTNTGNVFAYSSSTADQSLNVGNISTTGGYVTLASNTTGLLALPSSIKTINGNVAIVSGGSIQFGGASSVVDTYGGALNIISGAQFTVNGTTINVTGANNTNGSISLSPGGTTFDTTTLNVNGTAGSLTIAAFAGTSGLASINAQNYQLNTTLDSNGTGANGNVLVLIGDTNSSNSSYLGNINAAGTNNGGNVTIAAASPVINGGSLVLNGGAITSGSLSPGTPQNSNINLNTIATNVGNVTLSSAGNISFTTIYDGNVAIISGGNITINPNGDIGTNGNSISLFAGAAFNNSGFTTTITGASSTGGSINIGSGVQLITFGSSPGQSGNITAAAFSGSNAGSGTIDGGNNMYDTVSGNLASGATNNILILGTNVTVGNLTAIGNLSPGSSNITIAAATAGVTSGGITINNAAITSGNAIVVGTPNPPSNLSELGSIITLGGNVTLASAGNINFSGSGNIAVTDGGQLNLIAGASFSNTGATINVVGGSSTGGSISLAQNLLLDSLNSTAGGNGGNILLVAYKGNGLNSGTVFGETAAPARIYAGGNGNGINGNVTVIAGGSVAKTIANIGNIDTTGGTGGGGNISLTTATPLVSSGGVSVNDGSITSGNFSTGTITKGSINVGTITAPGSTIIVTAGRSALTQTITDIGLGSNPGGTFKLTENSSMTLEVQPGGINGVNGTVNVTGGPNAGGSGGTIDLTNKGTGGIDITTGSNLAFSPGAGGGAGGHLTLNAGNKGNLTISAGTLNANASGPGNYSGGTITLLGSSINVVGASTVVTANGVGRGHGGNILIASKNGDITLGGFNNVSTISATGGASNGSRGGNVTVSAGGSLTDSGSINVSSTAANGTGGNITLAAGSAIAGSTLDINFNGTSGTNLNTSGSGNGMGGNIALISSGNILLNGANNSPGLVSGGGTITMAAGVEFARSGSKLVIDGASSTGGYITAYGGNTPISSSGGNVLMLAYGGSGALSGGIGVLDTMPITTGASGTLANGNVTIIGGGSNPASINISTINTVGGSGGNGNVIIEDATPVLNTGSLTINHGAIIAGSVSPGALQNGDISIGNITTTAGNVQIAGNGNVNTGLITTTTGNIFVYDGSTANNSLMIGYLTTNTGDITLASRTLGFLDIPQNLITDGGNVAIISGASIQFTAPTSEITTTGGSLTLLSGANFALTGPTTITVSGANSTNAFINFSSGGTLLSTANNSTDGNGGNLIMAAFGGASGVAPINSQDNMLTINTAGNGFGSNGNVQIITGNSNPTYNSYLGNINTAGGGGGGGNVQIAAAEPIIIGGALVITDGQIVSGNLSATNNVPGNLVIGTVTTSSGNVNINGGGNITSGAISTGFFLPTSSAFGNSGSVNIASSGGTLSLNTISTNGLSVGNFAGNITLTAPGGINMSDLNANGYIDSTGGTITISTPGGIIGTFINATGSLGGNAGSISTTSNTLVLNGTNGYGFSIDASADSNVGGNGGLISITTTSSLTFTVGGPTGGNGVVSSISANGVNGGFITLTNYGNSTTGNQIINSNVLANGTFGSGGNILFQGQQPAGSAPLISTINGLVQADNDANNSGIIGFNSGPYQSTFLLGTGFVDAGQAVRIGNLNPTTLAFQFPSGGSIFISPTLRLANIVEPSLPSSSFGTPTTTPNLLNYSRTAVDDTPFHRFPYIDKYDYPPSIFQLAARNNLAFIPGTKVYGSSFAGANLNKLIKDGLVIASNTGNNYLNIDRGNVLLSPDKDIIVGTHEGNVYVSRGAIIFLMESGHDVVIYDFSQNNSKQVSIIINKHKVFLEPGMMAVLTRQNVKQFEDIDADCHYVSYRNARLLNLAEKEIKVFMAKFSTSSAVLNVEPLQELLASSAKEDKIVLNQIAKSAVIMGGFSTEFEPSTATQLAAQQQNNEPATQQAIHPAVTQIGASGRQVTK